MQIIALRKTGLPIRPCSGGGRKHESHTYPRKSGKTMYKAICPGNRWGIR